MENTIHKQLIQNLEYLKLKEMILHLDSTINLINKNGMSFEEGLSKLTAYEIDHKEQNMIKSMLKVAGFPHLKELKDFDFSFQENINKEQIIDFANHRFIQQCENIVFLGNSGVGKNSFSYIDWNNCCKKENVNVLHKMSRLASAAKKS